MLSLVPAVLCFVGCQANAQAQLGDATPSDPTRPPAALACVVDGGLVALPDEVRESSGLAPSTRDGTFWTHNDAGNDAELFAIDRSGRIVQRVRVPGTTATDWEDIEAAPCDDGRCLYVGDIGDNDAERQTIAILRVPEPEAGSTETATPVTLRARYPGGLRDAESLFAGPDGDLFVVTKGREGPVELFRYPSPHRPGETVTLEVIGQLLPRPSDSDDRVTAATTSPDGRWAAIRTYRTLYLHSLPALVAGGPFDPIRFDLTGLGQSQGESLAMTPDGLVWMTAEADGDDAPPTLGRVRCELPG